MKDSPKILIVGNSSMIGSRLVELWPDEWKIEGAGIELAKNQKISIFSNLDITDNNQVKKVLSKTDCNVVVACSAITDVDGCQKEFGNEDGQAFQVNVLGTKNLAKACQISGKKLIYFSTDFIFDGKAGPYDETVKPASSKEKIPWYGWTKLKGEEAVQESGCEFLIARISYPYRANFPPKTDFVRNIITRLESNSLYPMFEDQFLTPTFIDDIAMALKTAIVRDLKGVYNVVDTVTLSAYDAALTIAQVFNFDYNHIRKNRFEDFARTNPQTAPRPMKGGLLADKINNELRKEGKSMKSFVEALQIFKEQILK